MDAADTLIEAAKSILPEELHETSAWFLKNFEVIDELLQTSLMAEKTRECYLKQAKENQEYLLWMLLAYQKFSQDQRSATLQIKME